MSGSHDSRKVSCFIPRSCFWRICHCILRKMHSRPRVLRPNKIILSLHFLESTSTIATTVLLTSITRTSRLRRVRLETDLDAQLLPLRRLVTRTLCIKRIEHVVDVDHYRYRISTELRTTEPKLPIPAQQLKTRTYKSTSQDPRSSPETSPTACHFSISRAGATWHHSL